MNEKLARAGRTELEATLRAPWFWYSLCCVLCWGPFAIFSRLGSMEVRPLDMQLLYTLGGIPVALAVLAVRRFQLEPSIRGAGYGIAVGVLTAVGNLALFAAYGTGANAAVVTVATGLYPVVTVILAIWLLRETLSVRQCVGLGFAMLGIVCFALSS